MASQDDPEQGEASGERMAVENLDDPGLQSGHPGIEFDSSSNSVLQRISRSGLGGIRKKYRSSR